MSPSLKLAIPAAALALAGCVSVPTGPSVMVLPGTGKTFDQFRADESGCRQYSYEQAGGQTATGAQTDAAVRSAAVGTVLGAAAGAAIGGHGSDAAVGAGIGLLTGSLIGASTGNMSAYEAQHRYDIAYTQCMYARGHRVPVSRNYAPQYSAPQPQYSAPQPQYSAPPTYSVPPPPPPNARPPAYSAPPPPPAGAPPPPPPGA